MIYVKKRFKWVQKVLWQELCELYHQFIRNQEIENQPFQKEGYLHYDKTVWHNFFLLSSVTGIKGHFLRVQKVIWHHCGSNRIITVTTRRLLKTQFSEKKNRAVIPVKKNILAVFSRFIEHGNCQATTYKGTQGTLPNIVQTMWLVL